MKTSNLLQSLKKNKTLTHEEIRYFLRSENITENERVRILKGLFQKELTSREIIDFIQLLQAEQAFPLCLPDAVDICGTGGSSLPCINTSTIVAFVLSALDIPIAKHGNKASSGKFGSFDLLEKLNIEI